VIDLERRTQGLFVHVGTGRRASELAIERVLRHRLPYNSRVTLRAGELAVSAALPPLGADEEARLAWLSGTLERSARWLAEHGEGEPIATKQPSEEDARQGIEALHWTAQAGGWSVRREGPLGIALARDGERASLLARADAKGVLVGAPLAGLETEHGEDAVRGALVHAALALNARLAFARLRIVEPEALGLQVECHLPGDAEPPLCEDELGFALEGVWHAAREAERTLACLRSPAVAREYATAQGLTRG